MSKLNKFTVGMIETVTKKIMADILFGYSKDEDKQYQLLTSLQNDIEAGWREEEAKNE